MTVDHGSRYFRQMSWFLSEWCWDFFSAVCSRAYPSWTQFGGVTRTYSSLGDRAIAVAAPRAWNSPVLVVRSSLLTASIQEKLENILSHLTLLSCLNIFVTQFLSFKLLGALVVPLGHLRRPSLLATSVILIDKWFNWLIDWWMDGWIDRSIDRSIDSFSCF